MIIIIKSLFSEGIGIYNNVTESEPIIGLHWRQAVHPPWRATVGPMPFIDDLYFANCLLGCINVLS